MYIKGRVTRRGVEYSLRESYREESAWKHRVLVELGNDPNRYVEYPGGNGFYISEEIEEILDAKAAAYSYDELEAVFLPFVDPRIRRVAEQFQREDQGGKKAWSRSPKEMWERQKGLPSFDKRRLHFLRCGRVDIGNLDARGWKFLDVLLEKSRDEIESLFDTMERDLKPHEIRSYLYTALHLQRRFAGYCTRNQPSVLDPEKVDESFVDELCRLNQDRGFFSGLKRSSWNLLHPYLRKYLILYFDNEFDRGGAWSEYVRDFQRRRQFYRGPRLRVEPSVSKTEALKSLGIGAAEFEDMSRAELTRCYRKRAMETHPDRGGDQKEFVGIRRAFETLLAGKSS